MISAEQYFNGKPHSPEQATAAAALLEKVNALLGWARLGGYAGTADPDTSCQIGGDCKKGNGDGGFRGPDEPGAPKSNHKTAHAVDVYDPGDKLDRILDDQVLERFGLYREHPDHTPTWCHLQDVAPKSGRRSFLP